MTTRYSPEEFVHGKDLRTPEILLFEMWMREEDNELITEYIFNLVNRLKHCQELTVANRRKRWKKENFGTTKKRSCKNFRWEKKY